MNNDARMENIEGNSYDLVFGNGDRYHISREFVDCCIDMKEKKTVARSYFLLSGPAIEGKMSLYSFVSGMYVKDGEENDISFSMSPFWKETNSDDKKLLAKFFKTMVFNPLSKIYLDSGRTAFQDWMSVEGSLERLTNASQTKKTKGTTSDIMKRLEENSNSR